MTSRLSRTVRTPLVPDEALARYRTDYGIFCLRPSAALAPAREEEIGAALAAAREFGVPLVARAGGSGTGGAAVTDGVLLLFTGGSFADVDVDPATRLVTCGPGVRHDVLQNALAAHTLRLPSDPSSGPLSYIGGNIATRASGPHALRHGAIDRYIRHVRLLLADGSVVDTRHPETAPAGLVGQLRMLGEAIRSDADALTRLEARRGMKCASGYDLLALLDHIDDPIAALPRLVCGSMGTLGIVTEAVFEAAPEPHERAAVLLRFADASDACRAAAELRRDAAAVEIVGRTALDLIRAHTDSLSGDDRSDALLIVEYEDDNPSAASVAAAAAIEASYKLTVRPEVALDADRIAAVWRARKALLPVIRRAAGERRAYSVVNDVGVPVEHLADLLRGVERIFTSHGVDAPIYGHAGSGNLHLRPLFRRGDLLTVRSVARDVYALTTSLGGTVTAEHGLGRLRVPFLQQEWGATIVRFMARLASIFDPTTTLNPGVVTARSPETYVTREWELPPTL